MPERDRRREHDRAPLAVICALEEELRHLREALPPGREEARGGRSVWRTEVAGHPVLLACCGIGMLSAAAVTEAVVGHERPLAVLNFGCVGAHRPDLLPGDMVVGQRVVAYDSVRESPDGAEHFNDMHYLYRGERRFISHVEAHPRLLARALRVAGTLEGQHEPWPAAVGWPSEIPHRPPRVVVGTVASADRWNRSPGRIAALVERHGSHCEDMEAAAIALTCLSHDVPFLTVKDVSNNELLAGSVTESGRFVLEHLSDELGRRAGALTLAILTDLAVSPDPLA
jgi:adenosylhomocysteine nucleosidase